MIVETLLIILTLITISGFFRAIWWFSILDFFRLQYAGLSFLLLLISFFEVNIFMCGLSIILIAVNLFRIRKFLPQFSPGNIYQNKKIFSVNAYKDNKTPEELKQVIQGANPDILLIMEMTQELRDALNELLHSYDYILESSVRDGFNICLFSRVPLENEQVTYHGPNDTPLLQATVKIENKLYRVFSAHPKPALNSKWYQERHAYFQDIERIISNENKPVIVMGDFNSVPWENHFSRFLNNTNLKSTVEGYGYKITWPVFFPLLGIPMDHILISKNEQYSDLSVGPHVGSDHYPIGINL